MKISNFPDKEFKVMVITNLGRRMDEHSENFNKEIENIRKYQIEVIELKNTLEGFNSTLDESEERISKL